MDLKDLYKIVDLNNQLKEVETIISLVKKHKNNWWTLNFPSDDECNVNSDIVRVKIEEALIKSKQEIIKQIKKI